MKHSLIVFICMLMMACNNGTGTQTETPATPQQDTVTNTPVATTPASDTANTKVLKNGKMVHLSEGTAEERKQLEGMLSSKKLKNNECCGEEMCVNGYIWACSRFNDNVCRWFKSDWKCN